MRRRGKTEILEEYERLFDRFLAFGEAMSIAYSSEYAARMRTSRRPRKEDWIALVERKEVTASQLLSGLKQAMTDYAEQMSEMLHDKPDLAAQIMARYRELTGRDALADVGVLDKAALPILRRGRARNEDEAYVLTAYLSMMEPDVLGSSGRAKAEQMLADWAASLPSIPNTSS